MKNLKMIFTLVMIIITLATNCQITIWSEDFSAYADGATVGNDVNPPLGSDWTAAGCPSCAANSTDWWEVRSGRMEARDVNDDIVYLQTESIDISACTGVQFSVLCTEQGDHDGLYLNSDICTDQSNEDFADVMYRIDGGSWILISNYLGWCGLYNSCGTHTFYSDNADDGDCRSLDSDWESSTVSVSGLSGNTLEIRLQARNSSSSEYIQFDNIIVQCMLLLPVDFLEFEGERLNESCELKWSTASERNNDRFEVEFSHDLESFYYAGMIQGAGTSEQQMNYRFNHSVPNLYQDLETLYYRIKQVDFNGTVSYSKVIALNQKIRKGEELILYPNPSNGSVKITLKNITQKGIVDIRDYSGRLIRQFEINPLENTQASQISLNNLQAGIYLIQFYTADSRIVKQLVVN